MMNQHSTRLKYFTGLLGLCLGLAFCASAQQRGGGFGGFGGAARSAAGTSSSTTARPYPNNSAIGDAYFSIDPETRRVVFIADEATAKSMAQVLTNLDRPKPQVLIKVVFLEVQHDDALDLGVEGTYGKSFGGSGGTNTTVLGTNFFGMPGASSTFGGANGIYQVMGQDYTVTLHAIAQASKAKVLSRPSILARNNQPATITVGQEVPLITSVRYDTFGNAINSVTYTSVGVILKVTPFITADGMVEMIVSPSISRLDPGPGIAISSTSSGTTITAPIIDIRSADTVAVTPDGQPVIIGGLIQSTKAETITKIPFLGDIPLLGTLFQRKQKDDAKSELIIFLTPHIVLAPTEMAALTVKERDRSGAAKGLTEQELNKFLDELPTKKTSPDSNSKSGKKAPVTPANN
jgi:type II secretory pathway component GspD/PulD (secretin)